jgi:hypothetical protein
MDLNESKTKGQLGLGLQREYVYFGRMKISQIIIWCACFGSTYTKNNIR